ncbi:matrixin family metalloprotease [Sorangium sp. So ce726]|uniref:matrixin family metalloprotease n=1 Tax=Sorangium sp. So ce726 TaxID=3133319 RepID=UPI003F623472
MATPEANVRICYDRKLPLALEEDGRRAAVRENPANDVDPSLNPNDPNLTPSEKIALIASKRWRPGKLLKIRFLDGSSTMRAKVERYAQEWTKHANIQFDFGDSKYAEIRISFYADEGSWSALGTEALVEDYFPLKQPTMNFGWLRDDTSDEECSRVVLHEFGHALGAIHEHKNPRGGIVWDKEAVYKYFSGPPNFWTKEEIDYNVIERYSENILLGTAFDPASIMIYPLPESLIISPAGFSAPLNTKLSPMDIDFIKIAYPHTPSAR